MLMRLSFARRLALIIWPTLVVLWLIAITVPIYSDGHFDGTVRPLPTQIASIVNLLEQAPAAQRKLILAAVTSQQFAASVEPGDSVDYVASGTMRRVAIEETLRVLADLGPRPISVTSPQVRAHFIIAMLISPTEYDIRIGMTTGDTLVVRTRTVLSSSMVSWPPGFGMGLFGLIVSICTLYAVNREIRPLARLATTVEKIDFETDTPTFPRDAHAAPEIQALIAAFAHLQQRLGQLLRSRMALIGGVSHDVRTFATRLRLRVERIDEPVERARAIKDIEDMIGLLDDALTACRAGAGGLSEELLDLVAVVRQEVADSQASGASVAFAPPPGAAEVLVLADRLALRRILSNLIDNALKYGRCAALGLSAQAAQAVLTIDDEGPGIPMEQRQAVLEPFVRLETSRSRATGGAGLGLAVVNALVRALGSEISIADAPGGGARIAVRLPIFRAA